MINAANLEPSGRVHDRGEARGRNGLAPYPLLDSVRKHTDFGGHLRGTAEAVNKVTHRVHDVGHYISSRMSVNTKCHGEVATLCVMTPGQATRLRALQKAAKFPSMAAFARVARVPDNNMRQHLSRDSIPKDAAENYVRAAKRTGATIEWLLYGTGQGPRELEGIAAAVDPIQVSQQNRTSQDGITFPIAVAVHPLIVFRSLPTPSRGAGAILMYREKAGVVTRPAEAEFSQEAFAFTIQDDELEPRFRRREVVMVDPDVTPVPDGDCLFAAKPADDGGFIGKPRRLVRIEPDHWVVRLFKENSPEEKLDRAEWSAWPIRGSYARR